MSWYDKNDKLNQMKNNICLKLLYYDVLYLQQQLNPTRRLDYMYGSDNTSKYLANAGLELQVVFIASLACFQLLINEVYESITGFLENWKKLT